MIKPAKLVKDGIIDGREAYYKDNGNQSVKRSLVKNFRVTLLEKRLTIGRTIRFRHIIRRTQFKLRGSGNEWNSVAYRKYVMRLTN